MLRPYRFGNPVSAEPGMLAGHIPQERDKTCQNKVLDPRP